MRRTLYWKRLLIVIVTGVLLSGAVFAVHHFQAKAQASVIKQQAERAATAAEADPTQRGEAIKHYERYLKFRPNDEAAFQKYANLLLEEVKANPAPGTTERVANGVEGFLRAFPNHPAERKQLVELYLGTGQFAKLTTAKQHLEMVLGAPGGEYRKNIEVLELASDCEYALGNVSAAIAHLEAAIATGAAPVRVYQQAARLHHINKEDPKRDASVDAILLAFRSGRFERNLEARVAAARLVMLRASGVAIKNLDEAQRDLTFAFAELGGSNDPDALLAKAELELESIKNPAEGAANRAQAEAHLRKAFDLDKKNVAVGMLLAEVLTAQGKRDEGIQTLKQTVEAIPTVGDLYFRVIDRLLDLGEKELSSTLVETKLAPDESKKNIVTYFRGRLAVLKQDWASAIKLLDEVLPNLVRVPMYHKKALVGLAVCYSAMQNPDKQLEYCRQAQRDDSGYVAAIIGEAEALARMGKHSDALGKYRALVNVYNLSAYRSELVRLELLDILSRPAETEARSWVRFEESLGPPESRTPDIQVYHADSLVARGRAPEAAKLLQDWLTTHPKDPKSAGVWVALARMKDGGKPDTAAAVLDEAQKAIGNTVEIRLARAGLLVARAKPATPAEFDALTTGTEGFSKSEQFRLLFGLGQAAARVADRGPDGEPVKALRTAALKYLRATAALDPKDLTCRAVLLDQAIAADQMDMVNQVLKEMAAVEGEVGPVGTLARIAIRLPEVKKATDPVTRAVGVKDLRALAARVRDLRPGWGRVHIALAQLDELDGLNDDALVNYRAAIDKGDRQEFVVRRAVDLYRLKQQDLQAVGLLNKLSTEVRLPDDLERFRAIRTMLDADIPKEARPTIDRVAPADSTDYRMMLLRGALLSAIREDEAALVAFRRAVELADGVPETWASLVGQLMKHGKVEDAKRAVTEAEKKLTAAPLKKGASPTELPLALGGLYEMVGDLKTALGYYVAAYKLAPLELNPVRQVILFSQRTGQADKATELLNQAKDSPASEVARWARRHLALTLISRPDAYTRRNEALALVERNLAAAPNDPEDVKARAVVWTADPVTREEGIRTLRQFGDRGDLTPDEFYLLGRLAFDQGKETEAAEFFKKAARIRPGVTAEHLAAVVRVYLALNQIRLAEDALERLKTNNPTSWEATREEARLLARKSKDKATLGELEDAKKLLDQARALVMKFPGWDASPNLASRTGPLFEEIGLPADAESAYTKFLAGSDAPGAHAPLAVLYIRQKQPEKAIKLAQDHEKKAPIQLTARLLTGAIRSKRADPVTEAAVEKWLDDALRAAAGKPELEAGLIGARAELLDAQGKYPEAIQEYERSVAKGKSDLVVNNLCMLLALHEPKRAEEAVKMMSDLIAIRGPVPAFLDTRAVAYLVSSRPAEAEKDLRMALVQYDRAAYRFHLAWAIDLNAIEGKRIFAVDELKRARLLGLTADDLHPIELKRYAELFAKYRLTVDK